MKSKWSVRPFLIGVTTGVLVASLGASALQNQSSLGKYWDQWTTRFQLQQYREVGAKITVRKNGVVIGELVPDGANWRFEPVSGNGFPVRDSEIKLSRNAVSGVTEAQIHKEAVK